MPNPWIKTVTFSLLVLALLTDFSEEKQRPCRRDWMYLGGSCYKFGREMMSWQDAANMCKQSGGYLAEINSEEENTLIVNQIRTIHASFYDHVGSHWIGSTDMFTEGGWWWLSNDGWIGPFTNWAPGQPDNAGGRRVGVIVKCRHRPLMVGNTRTDESAMSMMSEFGIKCGSNKKERMSGRIQGFTTIEHCLEIRPAFDYKWNDYMCSVRNLFVCETSPKYRPWIHHGVEGESE